MQGFMNKNWIFVIINISYRFSNILSLYWKKQYRDIFIIINLNFVIILILYKHVNIYYVFNNKIQTNLRTDFWQNSLKSKNHKCILVL